MPAVSRRTAARIWCKLLLFIFKLELRCKTVLFCTWMECFCSFGVQEGLLLHLWAKDEYAAPARACVKRGGEIGGKGGKGTKDFQNPEKVPTFVSPTTRQGRLIPASYQTLWHPNGALINSCRNRYKGLHSFYSLIRKATSSLKKRLTVLHSGAVIPGTLFSNAPFKSYECRGSGLASPDGWTSGYKGKHRIVPLYQDRQEKLSTTTYRVLKASFE